MTDLTLTDFIESELSYELDDGISDIDVRGIAADLAESLKTSGYCSDPYFEYDKALMCPISKRREKFCGCTMCASHAFCEMLRKEGYV